MNRFIIQAENGRLSPDQAQVVDCIEQWNWLHHDSPPLQFELCSSDDLATRTDVNALTPSGSIDFVERVMQRKLKNPNVHIQPINVPPSLASSNFTGRKIKRMSRKDLFTTFSSDKSTGYWSQEEFDGVFFVKSNLQCKGFFVDGNREYILKLISKYEQETEFFVSSALPCPILSEWRVFVYHERILDARPYCLPGIEISGTIEAPNYHFIQAVLRHWKPRPTACTLDVAALQDGRTVVVECHNFLSCGLYGFDSPYIPDMLNCAYADEIQSQNSRN